MHAIIHLAVLAVTVFLLARLLPAVRIRSAGTAVLVAVVFSLLNFFLGWLVRVVLFFSFSLGSSFFFSFSLGSSFFFSFSLGSTFFFSFSLGSSFFSTILG